MNTPRSISLGVLRAFRRVCDPRAREDVDLAAADIARDARGLHSEGHAALAIESLVAAKVLGTLLPIARGVAIRSLRCTLGLAAKEPVSVGHPAVSLGLPARQIVVPLLGVLTGLSAALVALMIGDGIPTQIDGTIGRLPMGRAVALYLPHAVALALPVACFLGFLVAGRRTANQRGGGHPIRLHRTALLVIVGFALLEATLLFAWIPKVNVDLVEIVSRAVPELPSSGPEVFAEVRSMTLGQLVEAKQNPELPALTRRMAHFGIHVRSSFAVACMLLALLGLQMGTRGPRRAVPSYALAGVVSLLWFASFYPIEYGVAQGAISPALAWLPMCAAFASTWLLVLLRDPPRRAGWDRN